ncbi:MAG TPA: GNAT family N-acetyltransferase [Steroidobacteraceae bacterium]|nr:GNAT family N-acetyltransferase [Steroidobacteraceae bacterium]
MSALSIELVRDEAAFAALAEDWWTLWRRAKAPPFLSPAWLLPWRGAFRAGPLLSAAVRDGARLVALAPFYIEDGALGRRLLPIGIALSDYLDVLIDPQYPTAASAMAEAFDTEEGWDVWSLEELPPGAAALSLPCPRRWREASERQSACPLLKLPPSLERLHENVPATRLRKLRMARNRALRRGGFEIAPVDAGSASLLLQELERLHGARWSGHRTSGVLEDASVRRFHAAALPALIEAGLARCWLASLGGHIVAAYYGLSDGRRAFGYLTGFDPEHAFESPGAVILGHAIESAVREGCSEFHFLRGRESYKYDWGAEDVWSVRRLFVRDTARERRRAPAAARRDGSYV